MSNDLKKIHKEILLDDGGKILLYDVMGKEVDLEIKNRNVVRVDQHDKEIWKIQSSAMNNEPAPYTNIWIEENNKLHAGCFNGIEAIINMENGNVIRDEFRR